MMIVQTNQMQDANVPLTHHLGQYPQPYAMHIVEHCHLLSALSHQLAYPCELQQIHHMQLTDQFHLLMCPEHFQEKALY
jgi:hypothetical protein